MLKIFKKIGGGAWPPHIKDWPHFGPPKMKTQLRHCSPRGWPRQSCLQVSLFRHSLSAHSRPLPPSLSLQCTSTPFIQYTGGLPLTPLPSIVLSCTLCKVTFIHSHHMSILSQHASLHPINHPTIHSHCCFAHTKPPIHVLITLSIPTLTHHRHPASGPHVTHFLSSYS